MNDRQKRDTLNRALRDALLHLYDPPILRKNRLVAWLGLIGETDPASVLRTALFQAIEECKPATDVPTQAKAWRIYYLLRQRYVEGFSPPEVAANLCVGGRQLRRLHALALEALGDRLSVHYDLAQKVTEVEARPQDATAPAAHAPAADQELAWLAESFPIEVIDVNDLIQSVITLLTPLMQGQKVTVISTLPQSLPPVAVQISPTRHARLNVLKTAIRVSPEGHIRLREGANVSIHLQEERDGLEIIRRLLRLSGASLEVRTAGNDQEGVQFTVGLPLAEEVPVLFVDDNADALQLFARYLEGTRYRFIGYRDARQAVSMAQEIYPRVIVLDLMLPHIDGWEILGRLREHPHTSHIPVIICTILPEEELALTFGAAALMRKPVSREELLSVLDRQVARQTESD